MRQDVIDLPEVLERVQNDRELLLELFDIFLNDCPEKIRTITQALQTSDYEKLKEASHAMKGASGNISAKKIHATFISIEQKAKAQTIEGIAGLLKELEGQMNDLKAFCDQYKLECKKSS